MKEIVLTRRPHVKSLVVILTLVFSQQAFATCVQTAPSESSGGASATDDIPDSAVKLLEAAIEHERVTKNIPAMSVAIVSQDRVVWAKGFGFNDQQQSKPASEHSVYRVGSVSKLFTDIAVMQLVEQGKLSLDAPVSDVIPEFHPKQKDGEPAITLRMLMSHRSGLVREPPKGNYFDDSGTGLAATVASLNDTALTYPSNSRTKYSNAGIAVVGHVLARKLNASFGSCIQDAILKPLNMEHSDFQFSSAVQASYCTSWMWTLDGRRFVAPNFELGMSPAGNLYSSVMDFSTFARCILNNGKLPNGGQLLKPETLEQMTTAQVDGDGRPLPFGIGFAVGKLDGHRRIGHDGAIYGCSTQLAILPDDDLAVVAVSSLDGSNGIVNRLGDYALRLMLASRQKQPLPAWRRTSPIPRDRSQELAGIYKSETGFAEITELAGRCYLKSGVFRSELRLTADGTIVADDVNSFGNELVPLDGARIRIGTKEYTREADIPPDDCPAHWKGLVGEYGPDHNILYV